MGGRTWVQGKLFATKAKASARGGELRRARRRLSYARVTRDPDAALSYAESRLVAAQVTRGIAAAFARLDPGEQAELRAIFARRPSWARSA